MGGRQSKRSVDISGPPKKGELENGGVEEGGKLERLEESDVAVAKTTQNGTAPHTASTPVTEEAQPVINGNSAVAETTPEKKEETEESNSEENKDESLVNGSPESPEDKDKSTDEAAATPDKDKKKKEKSKKKWSFRSISFSRKDKSKPNLSKDDKNGSITKEPVAEAVEAEAAANTEAIPVKDDEAKKEEPTERTEEEEKKKEEKLESSTEVLSPETTPASPAEAPTPAPASPIPAPVETPAAPVPPTPAPASPAPSPPAPVEPAAPTPAPVVPEPVAEPVVETVSAPVVEAVQETIAEKPQEVPVVVEPEVEAKTEVKVEELPPPLPASPPPTEAPPPTPVATTPAPASMIPDVSLHAEVDSQENEVVGDGGESMAEPVDVEPTLDTETEEKLGETLLVNGIGDHTHKFVLEEEITEKVEMVTENFKTIVTDSIISTQVTVSDNSDEKNLEQTASAAE